MHSNMLNTEHGVPEVMILWGHVKDFGVVSLKLHRTPLRQNEPESKMEVLVSCVYLNAGSVHGEAF